METGTLLFDALAAGRAVWLPQVGSLVPESHGAWQRSRKRLEVPLRRVVFHEEQHGVSLVDLIGSPSAEETYDHWLAGVRTEEGLSIPGVGELVQGAFTASHQLDVALNPLGHGPLDLRPRRSNAPLFILLALLLLGGAGYGVWWWKNNAACGGMQNEASKAITEIEPQQPVAVEHEAPEQSRNIVPDEPEDTRHSLHAVAGRTYVVLGVYSIEENARRAAANYPEARIYPYGDAGGGR